MHTAPIYASATAATHVKLQCEHLTTVVPPQGYNCYLQEISCLTVCYCSLHTQEAGFSKFLPVISQMSSSWNSCSDVHFHLFILTIFQWHSHLPQKNPPPLFGILFTSHLSRSGELLIELCFRAVEGGFSLLPLWLSTLCVHQPSLSQSTIRPCSCQPAPHSPRVEEAVICFTPRRQQIEEVTGWACCAHGAFR